jgi:hypothetical protein
MHFAAPILVSLSVLVAAAEPFPSGWAAENMKPVGYSGLDGHGGAFKIVVRRAGDKWYAYLGHFWESGWIILDVTDAANPKFVKFVPGPGNTNTYQVELHDDILITALQQRPRNWGGDPKRPNDEGALIWDVSDPVNWKLQRDAGGCRGRRKARHRPEPISRFTGRRSSARMATRPTWDTGARW